MHPAETGPVLFIQPHYDDVALSCGGTVALAVDRGDPVHLVTVFASDILDEMVGDFAAWKHERWKLADPDAVAAQRRAEDAAAAAVLGCPVRWLGMPDAIYRGDRYRSDAELFGALHPEEFELAAFLAEEIRQLPEWREGTRVFVPLAVGSHVDHQLVFEAGRTLAGHGVPVFAYEDCPYAIHSPGGLPKRRAEVPGALGAPVTVDIGEAGLSRRQASIRCYASQLPVIFRFTDDIDRAVAGFARRTGDGRPAERFWPVMGRGG